MVLSVEIEEGLDEIFHETDLVAFKTKLSVEKQLTRIDHFQDVTDDELMSYGLAMPAIRRLRNAIEKRQKLQAKKGKRTGNKREKLVKVIANEGDVHLAIQSAPSSSLATKNGEAPPCIIARDEVKLMENIGEGTFAVVKRGIWRRSDSGAKMDCAVKILRDMSEHVKADLNAEITNMQKLCHQNLVRLHGVVLGDPTLMVLEFCDNGSLLDRLRSRTKERLLVTRLHNYAQQIANGMSYLESRRFVHRDLATRNVLLTDNEEVVKICDFGLTRALNENERLYEMSGQKKVPFSWCPPESLRLRQFSHKSDVWAFGVTLWELYTYGEEPWVGYNAVDVLQAVEAGQRLKMPKFCSKEIYDIMQMCWRISADDRPKFGHLRTLLQDIKFMVAVCRNGYSSNADSALELKPDERVILISERDDANWFGQSLSSRIFGVFPRAFVTLFSSRRLPSSQDDGKVSLHTSDYSSRVKQPLSLLMDTQNITMKNSNNGVALRHRREISNPIAGSFIHTGHGDTDERKCWGYVEKIDEIYLKNAILGTSVPFKYTASSGIVSSVPDIMNIPNPENTNTSTLSASGTQHQRAVSAGNLDFNLFTDTTFGPFSSLSSTLKTIPAPAFNDLNNFKCNNNATVASMVQSSTKSAQLQMPPAKTVTKSTTKAASKYDSSISIPRPNRASPAFGGNAASLRITPPPTKLEPAVMTSKPSTSSLPATGLSAAIPMTISRPNNDNSFADLFDFYKTPSTLPVVNGSTANILPVKSTTEKDPFIVEESIKSLLTKTTHNNAASDLNKTQNPKKPISVEEFAISSILPPPNQGKRSPARGASTVELKQEPKLKEPTEAKTSTPVNLVTANDARKIQPVVPPGAPHSFVPPVSKPPLLVPEKLKAFEADLLPPPSELLLSGIASSNVPMNFNGSLSSSNGSFLSNSTLVFAPPSCSTFIEQPMSNQMIPGLNRYQPIFAIEDHTNNALGNAAGSRVRYGANGIPILEPTPAPIATPKPSNAPKTSVPSSNEIVSPKIDLQDLNTDLMIENIAKSADFASKEQCRAALLRNGFDVDAAIRTLKVEKLLEMGLTGDRYLAASALDAVKWNVNEAANRLLPA